MSDYSQGPGWWEASDDKWYPPDQAPGPSPADAPASGAPSYGTSGAAAPSYRPPAYGPAPGYGPPGYQPPGYGPPGYGPPGPGYAPVGGFAPMAGSPYGSGVPSVQGLATASMVLGILALVMFWCWFIGIVFALVGLPLGLVALSRISKGTASPEGKGMAVAGLICSGLALVGSIGFLVLIYGSG